MKKISIVVNFFIRIIIKNYWCDIKSENVLMLISNEKYKKKMKKRFINSCCSILFCIDAWQTSPIFLVVVVALSSRGEMICGGQITVIYHPLFYFFNQKEINLSFDITSQDKFFKGQIL
jgi:hypothetical protein